MLHDLKALKAFEIRCSNLGSIDNKVGGARLFVSSGYFSRSIKNDKVMAHDLTFDFFPGRSFHVFLFKDVRNVSDLRSQLVNKSMQPELALIDATKVCEIFPLHLAAFKALMHESRKTMKTHTIHSEVVFMLSGSKHIAEAYRVFGPSDTTTHLLVGIFDPTEEDIKTISEELIQGSLAPIDELPSVSSVRAVQQAYKLTTEELRVCSAQDLAVARIGSMEVPAGQ